MSGKDEKPNQPKLVCSYCGHEIFRQVYYGYKIQYFNPTSGEEWDGGWEGEDFEEWECAECCRTVPEEVRERLMGMIFE